MASTVASLDMVGSGLEGGSFAVVSFGGLQMAFAGAFIGAFIEAFIEAFAMAFAKAFTKASTMDTTSKNSHMVPTSTSTAD